MSLSKTTLEDFVSSETETKIETGAVGEQATAREEALEGGARYRSPITTDASDAGEDLSHEKCVCQGCDATVTPTYWRGNSDNDDVLWHCHNCPDVNQSDMKNGAGAKPGFEPRIKNHQTRQGGEF